MALKKTIVMPQGYEIKDAYHKIESLTIHPKDAVTFVMRGYENANADKPLFIEFMFSGPYDITGENPIKQAYEYVKTTAEFNGAKDC